ncbi:MAG: IS66 family transposase [Acidobacteriota bacterium]|nr:IS66 family transposase [Acidobacteriota bacterium]
MERSEAEAIFEQGRDVVVRVLLELSVQNERLAAQVDKLTVRVARQDERIAGLERQLKRSSRNSSQPPSQDPPSSQPRRGKDPSGQPQGAQGGHEGHGRELLPACAVDEIVEHWPRRCRCGHIFSQDERRAVGEPVRHQVEELPLISATVTEHRAQRVRCPQCGRRARAELPAEVLGSAFGPRLQAAATVLSVRNRISRRDTAELMEELFGARICAGSIDAILARAGEALAEPYEGLHERIAVARALNMDETGWRTAGERRALWGVFTGRHALFRVAPDRHEDNAKALLCDTKAIVTSDRWWAYGHLPLSRRQICWSHLRRDFRAHAEGLAAEKEFGEMGLCLCEEVFWAWEVFCNTRDRRELKATVSRLQRKYKPLISAYAAKRARNKRCRGMARNLLKLWPALWSFAGAAGVEPTNNHAERSLRGAVIYRKLSLGTQSEGGERRIERLLSAHVTCRLQRRSLFAYLTELLAAHACGDPAPLLG